MSDQAAVLTERRERVLVITLNRPEQRNAINADVANSVAEALDQLDADASLSVGIVTGAGGYFCAGMDLKAFASGQRPWVEGRGFGGIVERSSDKPLIAAIEGFAVAGGLEIALVCDLIVAASGAKLGIPEVKRSLVAAGGGLLRLPRMLPRNIANELALTGDPITAERGYELGLVNRVSTRGGALDAALELAATIAANGPLALAGSKRILRDSIDWSQSEAFERQAPIWQPIFASEDARERLRPHSPRSARPSGRVGSRSPVGSDAGGLSGSDAGGLSWFPGRKVPQRLTHSECRGHDRAWPAVLAVLAQVDPLPRAERQAALRDRQCERRTEQRGLDVGGHVVRTLDRVGPERGALGDGVIKPGLEVAPNIG